MGVCSRVRDKLFLVQVLNRLKCLIRADLEQSGTYVLKLCKVKQKRRIFGLLLSGNLGDGAG